MRIETMTTGAAVHVSPLDDTVELRIGEPADAGSRVTSLSLPQAETVLHALGLEIAQIKERQRRAAEEGQRLARIVAETEVRRR